MKAILDMEQSPNPLYKKFKSLSADKLNQALQEACQEGSLDEVKYLLTSKDLANHADINHDEYMPLLYACITGQFEVIKYLIHSPDLKEKADIHKDKDNCFKVLCSMNHLDILRYFIFELGIEKTEPIKKYLENFPKKKATDWFELREVNEQLQGSLPINNISHKTNKI